MVNRILFDQLTNFDELVKTTVGLIKESKKATEGPLYIVNSFEDLISNIKETQKGKITAIVGRPSMGKTIFALNIIKRIVKENTPALVFSLSLQKEDWTRCFLCSSANVDLINSVTGFLSDEELARLNEAAQKFFYFPLFVKDDDRRLEAIIKTISESIKEHKIEFVLIDGISNIYGNHIQTQKGRGLRYDKQLRNLKEKVIEWDIPVLITQGLSRRIERDPYLLIPKHEYGIKEGNLSQHVSKILQLYREEYYNPKKRNRGIMDIRIPAMKYGERDRSVRVYFNRCMGVVEDLIEPKGRN